jgi:glycine oxidase
VTEAPRTSGYDVGVIGAGVIGLACAWRLACSGRSVLVLDRDRPGAGASGVAAGLLAPVTELSWGEEELLRLNLESARRWPAFDAELREWARGETGYEPSGALRIAVDRDDAGELRRMYEFQRSLGLDVEWLVPSACREAEPGLAPGIAGGVSARHDHQVDPRRLVGALATAVERAGAEIVAGTAVTAVAIDGERVTGLETVRGPVRCANVVVAAGSWASDIAGVAPETAPPVRPVKGQILRLRGGPGQLARRAVSTLRCYVVPRPDGEVVVGATVEERGFDTSVTAGGVLELLEAAREVLPDVAELELAESAARLRPGTPDNLPVVGAGAAGGLVWATGHYRNGILLAPITADAVVATLDGEEAPLGQAAAPGRFATTPVGAGVT